MPLARLYAATGGRLLPLDGGPAVVPPTGGGGGDTPPPVGNVNAMLVGAAGVALNGSDFPALDAAAGPFTVRRSYDTNLPATFAGSVAGMDVGMRASVWSCKPDLAQLASGALDTAIKAFVASIPDTHVAWLTCWHEPDGKIRKGQFTLAQYVPAFTHWCQVVKAAAVTYSKPHVYTTQIHEAWSGQHPAAGTTYGELWPGDGLVDCFAVDGYSNTGSGSALWGPAVTFATSKGVPWGIAEVGCAGTMDTAWMQAQADYATTHKAGGQHTRCAYFCWFSNETGGVLATPGTNGPAQLKAKSISQANYTDFNSFVL